MFRLAVINCRIIFITKTKMTFATDLKMNKANTENKVNRYKS